MEKGISHRPHASHESMNPIKLHKLVSLGKAITEREETIEILKSQTISKCNETLKYVVLQGRDLREARASIPSSEWMKWLSIHCPRTTPCMAQRYMQLEFTDLAVEFTETDTLRAALALYDSPKQSNSEHKSRPPYLEALYRVSKILRYIRDNPINQWPKEGVDALREDLKPIVSQLWPALFK